MLYIVEEKKGPSVRQVMRNESMIRKILDGKDVADAKKRGSKIANNRSARRGNVKSRTKSV